MNPLVSCEKSIFPKPHLGRNDSPPYGTTSSTVLGIFFRFNPYMKVFPLGNPQVTRGLNTKIVDRMMGGPRRGNHHPTIQNQLGSTHPFPLLKSGGNTIKKRIEYHPPIDYFDLYFVYWLRCAGVLKMGVSLIHFDRIVHLNNHPAIKGYPILGNPFNKHH